MTEYAAIEDSPTQVLGHPLFQEMPDDVSAILLRDCATLHIENGGTLFTEGAEAVEYLYVQSGDVEVLRHTRDNQIRVFHIFHPGQLLAETAMFMSHGRYPMQARARGDAVVLYLKRRGLLDACRVWPTLAMRLLTRLSDRVYHRINEVEWFSDSTATERLADYLLRLLPDRHSHVNLPLTQRQLAASLGIRAETLSRLLAEWVEQGVLTGSRRQWTVQDRATLESIARSLRRDF